VLALALLSSLLLTSCFPTGTGRAQDDFGSADGSTPSFLDEQLLENLYIDADISFDPDLQWKTIEVGYRGFDKEDCLDIFAQGREIEQQHDSDSVIPSATEQESIYFFSDESMLAVDAGTVRYNKPESVRRPDSDATYDNAIDGYYWLRDDLGEIYDQGEVEGLGRAEAIDMVTSVVTSLGLPVDPVPDVYALDYETLMSDWKDYFLKDGVTPAKPWAEDDGAYAVVFHERIGGLPVTDVGYTNIEMGFPINGGRIRGIVSKDGLIAFRCSGIFSELSAQPSTLISLDAAIEAVKTKYRDIIITDPVTITAVSAVLLPCYTSIEPPEVRLIPAWVFLASQTLMEQSPDGLVLATHSFNIIINGETGAELRIGSPA
jgi:hypothetical protein